MALLNNYELEKSSIVANSLMNRERRIAGSNRYTKELRFDPIQLLKRRMETEQQGERPRVGVGKKPTKRKGVRGTRLSES